MKSSIAHSLNQFKVLLLSGLAILIAQRVNMGSEMDITASMIGMLLICVIAIVALKIKEIMPLDIPAFAWASLLGLLITLPISPIADIILTFVGSISIGVVGTVILAVAGISMGTRLKDIKKLSWRIVLVSFVVFLGTFYGSAIVSHIILLIQGII